MREAPHRQTLPDYRQSITDINTMVRRSRKEMARLYEEKKLVAESQGSKVDVNKADTRGMTPLHAAGIR